MINRNLSDKCLYKNEVMLDMKLFRALPWKESILNSNDKVFSNNIISNNINLMNEIYSHIMPSYKLSQASKRKTIYSFTDDIDVAYRLVTNYPEIYNKIGYIELDITGESSALIENSKKILLVKPIFRFSDWIDLASYNVIITEDINTIITVNNTNYKREPLPLINTLIPSRWGALSLASTAREYAVICKDLVPSILSEEQIDNEINNKEIQNYDLLLSNNIFKKRYIINSMEKSFKQINISQSRSEYLQKMLKEYKANYLCCEHIY